MHTTDLCQNWDENLALVEFSYNNSYHASIGMVPHKELYERKCRSIFCWIESIKRISSDRVALVRETNEKIHVVKERLKVAQSRKKL